MNKIFISGNLTSDTEYAETISGTEVCKFRIAVPRYKNEKGAMIYDYFNVYSYHSTAIKCNKHLKKGSKVFVHGSIQNRTEEGKNGLKLILSEVIATTIEFDVPEQPDPYAITTDDKRTPLEVLAEQKPNKE